MKNKFGWITLGLLVLMVGCAHVQVDAPKDPIKMDISMRLDVYQHVVKDIDEIESIVSGGGNKQVAMAEWLLPSAYALEGLSPEVEQAAYRRRDRHNEVSALESRGILGEGRSALLVMRGEGDPAATQLMIDENNDRLVIYRSIAEKNSSTVEQIQKVYAERLQKSAPAGTPVQNPDGNWANKA